MSQQRTKEYFSKKGCGNVEHECLTFENETKKVKIWKIVELMFGGLFVGFANGLFGAGGGMIVVALLLYVAMLEDRKAHASALLVILPISLVSAVEYISKGAVELNASIFVTVGAVLGGILGSFVLKKINSKILPVMFFGIMIYVGIKMLL